MKIAETERLTIRRLVHRDSLFILELLNEPGWLQFIGDKGVKSEKDAVKYLRNGPLDMYDRLGFGLFAVELKEEGIPIGICGLIKRETLEDVDLGFAYLERFWGKGYAFESAKAVIEFAVQSVGLTRLVAITIKENEASKGLLEKLGFEFESVVDPKENLLLYARMMG